MLCSFRSFQPLLVSFRSRLALQAEILALRHQLNVLHRSVGPRRRLRASDRVLWVWLSQLRPDWRSALLIVKPETVIRWHRQGFRLYWRWKSRHLGRPGTGREIRELIRDIHPGADPSCLNLLPHRVMATHSSFKELLC